MSRGKPLKDKARNLEYVGYKNEAVDPEGLECFPSSGLSWVGEKGLDGEAANRERCQLARLPHPPTGTRQILLPFTTHNCSCKQVMERERNGKYMLMFRKGERREKQRQKGSHRLR
jgi:hypothetical protein